MRRGYRHKQGLAIENNFNKELSGKSKPVYVLKGNLQHVPAQSVVTYFKPSPRPADGYKPLVDLISLENGIIVKGSDRPLVSGHGATAASLNRYRPPGLFRRERYSFRLDSSGIGIFSPPSDAKKAISSLPKMLLLSGHHDMKMNELPGFSSQNFGRIDENPLPLSRAKYVVGDILVEDELALLRDKDSNPAFFGKNCRLRVISTDECHVNAEEHESGYVVFRLRRNCLALFKPAGSDESPILLKEKGIYVLPEEEVGKLTIYDLNNPKYYGDNELKVLHLASNERNLKQCAFYYSDTFLAQRKEEARNGVIHTTQDQKMPLATQQGIQLIYDPENHWHFQSDHQTGIPITHSLEMLLLKEDGKLIKQLALSISFNHANFNLARLNVPSNETLYHIESYGDCQIIKLDDSCAPPSKDNIGTLPIRAKMAYVRHGEALYFVHLRKGECEKLLASQDEIQKFDEVITPPTHRSRSLSDRELAQMQEIFPNYSIHKSTVFSSFKAGQHEIFNDTSLVKLEIAPHSSKESERIVTFAQFSILQIPFNFFGITKLQGRAHRAEANNYGRESDLKVYTSGTVLINNNIERFLNAWPIARVQITHEFEAQTRNHLALNVRVGIGYRIVDAIKSVVPNLLGEWNVDTFFSVVLLARFTDQIKEIVTQVLIRFIGEHTYEQIKKDLKSASGSQHAQSNYNSSLFQLEDRKEENMQSQLEDQIEERAQKIGLGTSDMYYRTNIADQAMQEKFANHLGEMYDKDHTLRTAEMDGKITDARLSADKARKDVMLAYAGKFCELSQGVNPEGLREVREIAEILDGKGSLSNSGESAKKTRGQNERASLFKKSNTLGLTKQLENKKENLEEEASSTTSP